MPTTGTYAPSSTGRTLPDAALSRCREYVPEYVLERDAGQLVSQGLLDALVDALHCRLDAVTHHAFLVRGGAVYCEQRAGFYCLVHVEEGHRLQLACQRPARAHAPPGLHEPGPAQFAEQPSDHHGVGVRAGRDLLGGGDLMA